MTRLMRWLSSPWPAATLLTPVTLGTIGGGVALNCRLPIYAGGPGSGGVPGLP
jgi:hypothetical protein